MGLAEQIAELTERLNRGQITESEYSSLVQDATRHASTGSSDSDVVPETSGTSSVSTATSTISPKKLLAGIVILFLVFVGFRVTRPGNPVESKEYKELLQRKSSLESSKSDLEKRLKDSESVQQEVDKYRGLVADWKAAIEEINGLGVDG